MSVVCNNLNVSVIEENECLSNSLLKINNNFLNLQQALSGLNSRFDKRIEIRTFFYYGPNANSNPGSGMADNQTSRPSDITIQAFVNSPSQLNLPAISKPGDIAYVIYQKTGYLNNLRQNVLSDFNIGTTTQDVIKFFAPIFIIWRLTSGESSIYTVDSPTFPKFFRSQTANISEGAPGWQNWNNPQNWSQF
jgi:hypothetical protein